MYTIWHIDKHGRTKLGQEENLKAAERFVNIYYAGRFKPGYDQAHIVNPHGVVVKRYEVDWMANSQFTPVAGMVWNFPSSSSSKIYSTQVNTTGIVSCNCPAWTFKKQGKPRSCKHIHNVIASQRLDVEVAGQYYILVDKKLKQAKAKFAAKTVPMPTKVGLTPQERFALLVADYESAVSRMAALDPSQLLEAAAEVEQAKWKVNAYMTLLESQGVAAVSMMEAAGGMQ